METVVYKMEADPDMRWLEVKDELPEPLIYMLQGRPIAATWVPLEIQEVMDDELPAGPVSDFPYMHLVPTFSSNAVRELEDLLTPHGELLPVRAKRGEFYVFNVTNVVDALDENRSELERFTSSGRVMRIRRFVFRPDAVAGQTIFKIPQMIRSLVLVTDQFRQRVEDRRLTGFVFERLWP